MVTMSKTAKLCFVSTTPPRSSIGKTLWQSTLLYQLRPSGLSSLPAGARNGM